MPEGPEVRRYANQLDCALRSKPLIGLTARTRAARAWLESHPGILEGRHVVKVRSHGKNLIGWIEGGYYFYSHLMMWGRWHVEMGPQNPGSVIFQERRERARIAVPDALAILYSAPVFEVGKGEPYEAIEYLRTLGPDVYPYPGHGPFDATEFLRRLEKDPERERTIGAALLDQTLLAGIGNYLRAEILFDCRLDPWRRVEDLTANNLDCLCRSIADVCARANVTGGATVPDDLRDRMRSDMELVYRPGKEYGTRHYVFRRTNLPCLICGTPIRQMRQLTWKDEEDEKERIIYYCPDCQQTTIAPTKAQLRRMAAAKKGREVGS